MDSDERYHSESEFSYPNEEDKENNAVRLYFCLSVTVSPPSLSPHRLPLRYARPRRFDHLPTAVNRVTLVA